MLPAVGVLGQHVGEFLPIAVSGLLHGLLHMSPGLAVPVCHAQLMVDE